MNFSSLKYSTLFSFFLAHTAMELVNPALAMDGPPPEVLPIKALSRARLSDGMEAFEAGRDAEAIQYFRKLDLPFGICYLEHLKEKDLPDSVPEFLRAASQCLFQASLDYKTYRATKGKQRLNALINLICKGRNGNGYACILIDRLAQQDSKIFMSLPKAYKDIQSVKDIFKKNKTVPLNTLGITPENLISLHDKWALPLSRSIKTFKANVGKFSEDNRGSLYMQMSDLFPNELYWPCLAIENGVHQGFLNLGKIFVKHEQDAEVRFFFPRLKSLNPGPELLVYYATACFAGKGGPENFEEARDSYKLAADQGDLSSQFTYAFMCGAGEGGRQDFVEARKYYKLSADQGDQEAQWKYAAMCHLGEGGPKEFVEARKYSKLAADRGHVEAQWAYACLCFKGEGGPQDLAEERKYSKLAADQGHVEAQWNYANLCFKGVGGPKDLDEARKYYKLAADQGKLEAQCDYASICYLGVGGGKDLAEACKYSKLAADQGHPGAQYSYGHMCYHGKGRAKDVVEARKYLKLAADQRDLGAQLDYACLCYFEERGPEDSSEARKYFKLVADQEHPDAQHNYACMCKRGEGGAEDVVEARKYFQMAAEQGLPLAIVALNVLEREQRAAESTETKSFIGENGQDHFEETFSDESVEITLPTLEKAVESSDEERSSDESLDIKENVSDKGKEELVPEKSVIIAEDVLPEELTLSEELRQYDQAQKSQNAADRQQKQAQKIRKKIQKQNQKEEPCASQTLIVPKETYNKGMQALNVIHDEKYEVSSTTNDFLKAVFGQGVKINTFSLTEGKKAFAELGCAVETVPGENSTLVSFTLNDGTIVKLKFHNPHGHGDNKLYKALQRYFKRFCISIGKTPENHCVK